MQFRDIPPNLRTPGTFVELVTPPRFPDVADKAELLRAEFAFTFEEVWGKYSNPYLASVLSRMLDAAGSITVGHVEADRVLMALPVDWKLSRALARRERMFPKWIVDRFNKIAESVIADYYPKREMEAEFMLRKINPPLISGMNAMLAEYEQRLIQCGAPTAAETARKRFGVSFHWLKITMLPGTAWGAKS